MNEFHPEMDVSANWRTFQEIFQDAEPFIPNIYRLIREENLNYLPQVHLLFGEMMRNHFGLVDMPILV
jgi:hypothetical protein